MWKHWHTNPHSKTKQTDFLWTTAKSLRLFNLLWIFFGQCLLCLCLCMCMCMCWFICKHTIWDPSRLFVFATNLSIMSRALTALGIEVHLWTEWAIKLAPAGVLVAMIQSAQWCSTQPCLAWLPRKPILLKRVFVMEGIWIYEHLLMTLLWKYPERWSNREKEGWKGREKARSKGLMERENEKEDVDEEKQCRRYER